MVLGLLLNKQQNKQETLNRWRGRTDEGAIRRARLLPVRCARCTRCARCGVSWHQFTHTMYFFKIRRNAFRRIGTEPADV